MNRLDTQSCWWYTSLMTRLIPAVFEHGSLNPVTPLSLPEHQRVLLAVTIADDDLPSLLISKAAEGSCSFDFLKAPAEDIYSPSDGEAIE